MTFPAAPIRQYARYERVRSADARHPGADPAQERNWWQGWLDVWIRDDAGWHGFFTADEPTDRDGYHRGRIPPDAPAGWLDLADLRPADRDRPQQYRITGADAVPPDWWPNSS